MTDMFLTLHNIFLTWFWLDLTYPDLTWHVLHLTWHVPDLTLHVSDFTWLDGPTNRPSTWDHQRDQQLWQIKCSKNWLTNLGPPTLALQRTLWLQDQMAYIMDNQNCTTKGSTNLVTTNAPQTWWPFGLPNSPPNWDPKWTTDPGTLLVRGPFGVPKLVVPSWWDTFFDHFMCLSCWSCWIDRQLRTTK